MVHKKFTHCNDCDCKETIRMGEQYQGTILSTIINSSSSQNHFHDPLNIHTDLSNNTEYPKLKHYKSSLVTWLMNIASSPSVLFSFEGSSLKI